MLFLFKRCIDFLNWEYTNKLDLIQGQKIQGPYYWSIKSLFSLLLTILVLLFNSCHINIFIIFYFFKNQQETSWIRYDQTA